MANSIVNRALFLSRPPVKDLGEPELLPAYAKLVLGFGADARLDRLGFVHVLVDSDGRVHYGFLQLIARAHTGADSCAMDVRGREESEKAKQNGEHR